MSYGAKIDDFSTDGGGGIPPCDHVAARYQGTEIEKRQPILFYPEIPVLLFKPPI